MQEIVYSFNYIVMNRLSITFITLIFFSCNNHTVKTGPTKPAKKVQSDLSKKHLKGNVSIVVTHSVIMKYGGGSEEDSVIELFNLHGYILGSEDFKRKGGMKHIYKYDKVDNMTEAVVEYKQIDLSKLRSVIKYKYDSLGYITECFDSGSNGITKYMWDSLGKVIKVENYRIGDTTSKTTFINSYDNKDRIVETKEYFKGLLRSQESFSYDSSGNVIKDTKFNSLTPEKQWNIYKYDAKNRLIEDSEKEVDKEADRWNRESITRYDTNGNETMSILYNANGEIQSKYIWDYKEYDKPGNWTKRIVTDSNNVPKYTEYRKIEYYQ